jgi:hypothetical protein
MLLFKVLNDNGTCCNGGTGKWHLPTKNDDGTWTPGEWMPAVEGDLEPCENGYHLCREQDLLKWLGPAIFAAEYRGEAVEAEDKIVVREARLLRRLEGWNERTARLFAADCAERVVHLCDDPRPRHAIGVARRYAGGEATAEELDAARDAAWDAAWAADWDAARAAERAAARDARAAARDAAWDARDARAAERAAAWAAAWAADWDAARAAARDARAAEQEWQAGRLMEYLNGA